jgi:hypothetical protein
MTCRPSAARWVASVRAALVRSAVTRAMPSRTAKARQARLPELEVGLRGTAHNVTDPNARFEATTLVEAMDTRVLAAALKQDVVAVTRPSRGKGSLNDRPTMPLSPALRMGHDVFEEPVSTSAAQQIWCVDKHAGRGDSGARFRNKNGHTFARQRFGPDASGTVGRLCD